MRPLPRSHEWDRGRGQRAPGLRSSSEIARRLGVGDETVKTHVSRILAKLELCDRTQAVVYAASHNLLPASTAARACGRDGTAGQSGRRPR